MTDHRLINPAMASFQTGQLFCIAKNGLDAPTTPLALNQGAKISPDVIAHNVFVVPVTVSCHDQPHLTILGSKDPQGYGAHPKALAPFESEHFRQFGYCQSFPS